jgi:hypothetical protein
VQVACRVIERVIGQMVVGLAIGLLCGEWEHGIMQVSGAPGSTQAQRAARCGHLAPRAVAAWAEQGPLCALPRCKQGGKSRDAHLSMKELY